MALFILMSMLSFFLTFDGAEGESHRRTHRALHSGGRVARAAPFQAQLVAPVSARPSSVQIRPAEGKQSPRDGRWKSSCKPSRMRRLGDEFRPARPPTTMPMVFSSAAASPRMIAVAPASCRWSRWPKSSSSTHLLRTGIARRRSRCQPEVVVSRCGEAASGRVGCCWCTYVEWLLAR